MMKRIGWIAALLVFAGSSAWAQLEGIPLGPVRLSLWGEISGTYDDNALLKVPKGLVQDRTIFEDPETGERPEAQEDIFYEAELGLKVFRQTDRFLASLSGLYVIRRYTDFDVLDDEDWAQGAELLRGDRVLDRFTVGFRESYQEVSDYEVVPYADDFTNPDTRDLFLSEDRTERVSRQILDMAGIVTWRITDKLGSDYSIGYGTIEYDTRLLYDWQDIKGQAEFDYQITDKNSVLLTGQYGQQDSDGFANEPDYYVIRGGLLNRTTDKLNFKGGAGLGRYDRFREEQDDTGSDIVEEGDEVIDYFSFDVAGSWDLSQRAKLEIIGRNAVQPAAQYQDNPKLVTVASVGLSYRLLERFRLAGTVSYREDDYYDLVQVDNDVFVDQVDEIWGGSVRLSYEPPRGYLILYAEGRYEDTETTLPDSDYHQLRLTLGLGLRI